VLSLSLNPLPQKTRDDATGSKREAENAKLTFFFKALSRDKKGPNILGSRGSSYAVVQTQGDIIKNSRLRKGVRIESKAFLVEQDGTRS
jgi:hypothetical protein